jgi:hypothetical protein
VIGRTAGVSPATTAGAGRARGPQRLPILEGVRLGRDGAAAQKSFVSDAAGKAKSVVLTEDGLRPAERLFTQLFAARRR